VSRWLSDDGRRSLDDGRRVWLDGVLTVAISGVVQTIMAEGNKLYRTISHSTLEPDREACTTGKAVSKSLVFDAVGVLCHWQCRLHCYVITGVHLQDCRLLYCTHQRAGAVQQAPRLVQHQTGPPQNAFILQIHCSTKQAAGGSAALLSGNCK
jgi:hypothetical protein